MTWEEFLETADDEQQLDDAPRLQPPRGGKRASRHVSDTEDLEDLADYASTRIDQGE